jgi:hypothetical protein
LTFAVHTGTMSREGDDMKRKRHEAPTVYVGDHTDRLSRIARVHHDPDERPSREDLAPQGSQLFKLPVELPRFLKPKRER